jgi:hypothetical protein
VIEETRSWRCPCGARGTMVIQVETEDEEGSFVCPKCATALTDCRPTRRAASGGTTRKGDPALPEDTMALTPDDLDRCAKEWAHTQELLGNLGAMAESSWALDWAERLIAEARRRT